MGRTKRHRHGRKIRSGTTVSKEECDYLPQLYRCLSNLGWRNESGLTCRNFGNTGRGLCSKSKYLSEGDTLISLPLQALITIATLDNDMTFRQLFAAYKFDKEHRVQFQALLALYILFHKHLAEASPWKAYINSIPATFTTPYFCAVNELYCLPESILQKTVEQNRRIRENFTILQEAFADAPLCKCCTRSYFTDIFTLEAFKWAFFAVNTRCVFVNTHKVISTKDNSISSYFRVLLSDECNLALAPFLDLFNHSDQSCTDAEIVASDPLNKELRFQIVLQKTAPISTYEQLFISYGNLTNLKLLTEYGFTLKRNAHDYFEFLLLDVENFIKAEKSFTKFIFHRNKFKFIRDHNLQDQLFVHLEDGLSHNLKVILHLLFKEQSHFPNVLNQVAFGSAAHFDDVATEAKMLIEYKICEYQTFIGDLQRLPKLTPSAMAVLQYLKYSIGYLQECAGNSF